MSLRVVINGFGRIGRNVVRAAKQQGADIDFVAANDLGDPDLMANLIKYDSVYGVAPFSVERTETGIKFDGDEMLLLSERDPAALPWKDLGVDVVIEATGFFKTHEQASLHLQAGARKVIVSAPSPDPDAMVVLGVNDDILDVKNHQIVSNASCTTNCLAPMLKVVDDNFGIVNGLFTTIHAYTGTQNIVDGNHKDMRRARAGAVNVIPASTGAAKAVGRVLPHLNGKLDGLAMRTPLPSGSLTDFVGTVEKSVSVEALNAALKAAANGNDGLAHVLEYTEDPIVSSDIVANPSSCIVDGPLTMVNGSTIKVCGWYDNEWGYSCRTVELAERLGKG